MNGGTATARHIDAGWVGTVTCPDIAVVATSDTYTYDGDGTVARVIGKTRTSVVVGAATTTSYGYDAAGHLVSQTPSDAPATAYSYDSLGRRATSVTGAVTTTYRYDEAGELCWTVTGSTVSTNTCADPPTGATVYGYDGAGRMLTETGSRTGGSSTYGYDPAGRLSTLRLVDGSYDTTQTRGYSPGRDLITTANSGSAPRSDAYSWDDAAGLPTVTEATRVTGAGADVAFGPAPENAWQTFERVESKGSPFPGYKGGSTFANDGRDGSQILSGWWASHLPRVGRQPVCKGRGSR